MKKIRNLLLVFLLLFGFSIDNVYADDETVEKKVLTYEDLPEVSLKENDYEISCTYKDGATLVISRDEVTLSNLSSSTSSSSSSNIGFYFADGQKNSMDNTTTTSYNHDNILENGHCPSKLYVYRVEGKYIDDIDDENTTTDNSNSGDDEDNEDNDSYFYSTKDDVVKDIAGTHRGFLWIGEYSNAELLSDSTTNLISEQAFLVTSKEYLVCDYESIISDDEQENGSGEGSPLSIYLFKNLSLMELGGYITPLPNVLTACPAVDSEKKTIYVNDPTAKTVGGGNLLVSSNKYNAIRFNYYNSLSECKTGNNNQTCMLFEYKGSRNKDGKIDDNETSVCDVLGNELVDQIQGIATILQVIVPVIVVILTAIDIGKIVVAGNIDEQLPKKKKVIIVRFFVMIVFFFLPLISKIIITLLNETGVVKIGNIDCIFK